MIRYRSTGLSLAVLAHGPNDASGVIVYRIEVGLHTGREAGSGIIAVVY